MAAGIRRQVPQTGQPNTGQNQLDTQIEAAVRSPGGGDLAAPPISDNANESFLVSGSLSRGLQCSFARLAALLHRAVDYTESGLEGSMLPAALHTFPRFSNWAPR